MELQARGVTPYIVLSGDSSIKYDNTGITQPLRDCDKLEEYLLSKGCPAGVILKEGESRDSISNFFYLKNLIFKPHGMYDVLIVSVQFRVERLRFLIQKVLGPDYCVDFDLVDFDQSEVYKKDTYVLDKQREFLKTMVDGDDAWLKDMFYDAPMYQFWKQHDQAETDPIKRHLI